MFHLFRPRGEPEDVEAAALRHAAAHSALIEALHRLLEERNQADGRTRRHAS